MCSYRNTRCDIGWGFLGFAIVTWPTPGVGSVTLGSPWPGARYGRSQPRLSAKPPRSGSGSVLRAKLQRLTPFALLAADESVNAGSRIGSEQKYANIGGTAAHTTGWRRTCPNRSSSIRRSLRP